MKITKLSYQRLDLVLHAPYTIAYETIDKAVNYILKIETDGMIVGFGCSAPDETVTLETFDMVEKAINEVIIPFLTGKDPLSYSNLLEELYVLLPLHYSALAMVDMALLDIMSKKSELPLYKFLGGIKNSIPTSITIGILPVDETLKVAKEYIDRGFSILKLKGGLSVEEDIEKMKLLYSKYPKIKHRFDANQGYNLRDVIAFNNATTDIGIEFIEQPFPIAIDKEMAKMRQEISTPLMVDESIKNLKDVQRLLECNAMDLINIKLMKVGGIKKAVEINALAESYDVNAMVGCIDECALGISCGLHYALSNSNIIYADLDGHLDFTNDPFKDGIFNLKNGILYATEDYGLGKASI